MSLHPRQKPLFLAIALCVALSALFAAPLAAAEFDHDHAAEEAHNCPVCLLITAAQLFQKVLKTVTVLLFSALVFIAGSFFSKKYIRIDCYSLSPVAQKVRFNS